VRDAISHHRRDATCSIARWVEHGGGERGQPCCVSTNGGKEATQEKSNSQKSSGGSNLSHGLGGKKMGDTLALKVGGVDVALYVRVQKREGG